MALPLRQQVQAVVQQAVSSGQIGQIAGVLARQVLQDAISRGVASPNYTRVVDGRAGAPEESVNLHGGNIVYLFAQLTDAVVYAFTYVREISPVKSGAFKASWVVLIDGRPWTGPLETIPKTAVQAIIVDSAPYARKLEQTVGARNPIYRITEQARQATLRRYKGLVVERKFVTLSGGITQRGWHVPYTRVTPPRGPITYPAVVISRR